MRGGVDAEGVVVPRMVHHKRALGLVEPLGQCLERPVLCQRCKASSHSGARIVTPPAARRPYGTLCSDAFGLHAYGLRPAYRRLVARERMTVLCRGSND
jgi:hypothetical protein